ncbi:MAG: ABC transporter substrate-binding protein [Caldilineaceae bacterium]|nr:ABC transporter substrate-binding protein [Caldilineaceae bacterium]
MFPPQHQAARSGAGSQLVAAVLAAVLALSGLSTAEAQSGIETPTAYRQSPFLPAPPQLEAVRDRLPPDPVVLDPVSLFPAPANEGMGPGEFGGNLVFVREPYARVDVPALALRENLLSAPAWDPADPRPNILARWLVHPDYRHFRLELRAGLRWSDGVPVTTRDVAFAFNDLWLDPEMNFLGMPDVIRAGGDGNGTPVSLQIQDDLVFYLEFDEPYGGFVRALTELHPAGYTDFLKPVHHLADFHPDYAAAADLRSRMQTSGTRYAWELLQAADCQPHELGQDACTGFPGLQPWTQTEVEPDGTVRLERNPWYFKVDPAGRQLPYIDTLAVLPPADPLSPSPTAAPGADLAAPADGWHRRADYLALGEGERHGIRILESAQNPVALNLNHTGEGERWQALVAMPDFGRALPLAINRPGLAEALSLPDGGTVHDPEAANRLLDGMGLTERTERGMRMGPDRHTAALTLAYAAEESGLHRMAERIVGDLAAVGLDVSAEPLPSRLLAIRMHSNQLQMSLGPSGGPGWATGATEDHLPTGATGRQWQLWHDSSGSLGTEPPVPILELYELDSVLASVPPSDQAARRARTRLGPINEEQSLILPLTPEAGQLVVFATGLGNLARGGPVEAAMAAAELFHWTASDNAAAGQ